MNSLKKEFSRIVMSWLLGGYFISFLQTVVLFVLTKNATLFINFSRITSFLILFGVFYGAMRSIEKREFKTGRVLFCNNAQKISSNYDSGKEIVTSQLKSNILHNLEWDHIMGLYFSWMWRSIVSGILWVVCLIFLLIPLFSLNKDLATLGVILAATVVGAYSGLSWMLSSKKRGTCVVFVPNE